MLCKNSLYTLDDDKLLEWNAVRKFYFIAPPLFSVFALLSDEAIQSQQIKAPGREQSGVIELRNDENALSRPATAAEVEQGPKENRSLVYRARAPRHSSVKSSPAMERSPVSSMMTIEGYGRKKVRSEESEVGDGAGLGLLAKAEYVVDAKLAFLVLYGREQGPLRWCTRKP